MRKRSKQCAKEASNAQKKTRVKWTRVKVFSNRVVSELRPPKKYLLEDRSFEEGTRLSSVQIVDRCYFFRWRIRARIRRFFRPIFRRPRPVFFTPTSNSSNAKTTTELNIKIASQRDGEAPPDRAQM